MGTYYTKDEHGKVNGIMTVANVYKFKGFTFEYSDFLGPLKVNKNFEPAAAMGRKFYKVYREWNKLTTEEKASTQIFG
jgi:hypothetical protein